MRSSGCSETSAIRFDSRHFGDIFCRLHNLTIVGETISPYCGQRLTCTEYRAVLTNTLVFEKSWLSRRSRWEPLKKSPVTQLSAGLTVSQRVLSPHP